MAVGPLSLNISALDGSGPATGRSARLFPNKWYFISTNQHVNLQLYTATDHPVWKGGNPGWARYMSRKVGQADEAPRHTGEMFPTGARPLEYILMVINAGGDEGAARRDGRYFPTVAHPGEPAIYEGRQWWTQISRRRLSTIYLSPGLPGFDPLGCPQKPWRQLWLNHTSRGATCELPKPVGGTTRAQDLMHENV